MMDRIELERSFSYHERALLYRCLVAWWSALLDHLKPDVMIFPTAPHLPPSPARRDGKLSPAAFGSCVSESLGIRAVTACMTRGVLKICLAINTIVSGVKPNARHVALRKLNQCL
jgi:hypothetical protein